MGGGDETGSGEETENLNYYSSTTNRAQIRRRAMTHHDDSFLTASESKSESESFRVFSWKVNLNT